MAKYTLVELPKVHSQAWMIEWMLTTSDPIGDWYADLPGSDISVEIKGITWGTAVVGIEGSNRGFIIPFTSGGTYQVIPGDTITGATSGATATVVAVNLNTTGTWGAGTAAGDLILVPNTVRGTFVATELIDVGSNSNVATASSGVGSPDSHTLNDVEGFALSYGSGNDSIYQIQEHVNIIRPRLTTVGSGAFVRVTLYLSTQIVAVKARS